VNRRKTPLRDNLGWFYGYVYRRKGETAETLKKAKNAPLSRTVRKPVETFDFKKREFGTIPPMSFYSPERVCSPYDEEISGDHLIFKCIPRGPQKDGGR